MSKSTNVRVVNPSTTVDCEPTLDHSWLTKFKRDVQAATEIHFIDMHNVLDLYDSKSMAPFQNLSGLRICLSWVGNVNNSIANVARDDMISHIETGNIHYGILCTARGNRNKKYKKLEKNGDVGDVLARKLCDKPNSKAGIIRRIKEMAPSAMKMTFYDDAQDHVQSVKTYVPEVTCFLIPHGESALESIELAIKNT